MATAEAELPVPAQVEESTRRADPPLALEGARQPVPDLRRVALARPDLRPLHHLAALARRTSSRRAGGRSSPSRAKLTLEQLRRGASTTRRSRPRSGRPSLIAVGGTILPIIVAALAGYAFAWLEFPGRDWLFIARDRAARRADPDGADPDVLALHRPRDLRHGAQPDPLPHRVRAAVRDLPAAQLLHRDPEGPDGGGADRRRLGDPDLRAADPAARAARRSPRSRSSSSSGRGTTCSSRSPSAARRSRSPSRSSRSCASSAPTSS